MYALHHVQLAMPAGREDDARAFFVDVLGMEEITKPPALAARGGVWFRAGELELHLGVEEGFSPARKAHPGILVGDLDDVVTRLVGAGVETRPDDLFPGHRRVYADDPFGNRLEFLQPLDDDRREGHIATVRRRVGHDHLLVPGVTICVFDEQDRLLLARHASADGRWVTPGGAVEPDDDLVGAVRREAREELGVEVGVVGLVGAFGPHRVEYPNGDVTSYVTSMFAVEVTSGELRADEVELLELGWWSESAMGELDVAHWLRPLLPAVFGWRRDGRTRFLGDRE